MSNQRDRIFWSKVDIKGPNECWIYKEGKNTGGYGKFWTGDRHMGAHRFAFESFNKYKIPKGQYILHKCDNPACCNPKHLYRGTQADNGRDMVLRRRLAPLRFNASKLHAKEILMIRKLLKTSKTRKTIAKIFKVSLETVYRIQRFSKFTCKEGYYV